METLTKEQRLKIYKEALEFLKEFEFLEAGFCMCMEKSHQRILGNYYFDCYNFHVLKRFFPELASFCPRNIEFESEKEGGRIINSSNGGYWFPREDTQKRINILIKIIKNVSNE